MDERERLVLELSREVPAEGVMAANALTTHAFSARIVGHFERQGPNTWDPSRFVEDEVGATIRIFPGVKVQVQNALGWFRMRYRGGVWVFAWLPEDGDSPDGLHEAFVQTCVSGYSNAPGIGAKAFIAKTLDT